MSQTNSQDSAKRRLQMADPVRPQAERGLGGDELSPMDPPDPYAPPGLEIDSTGPRHAFLRVLSEEHEAFLTELKTVEDALHAVKETGFREETYRALVHFLGVLDGDFVKHSRREETVLFPLLRERLIVDGEHSKTDDPITSAELMANEHLKAHRSGAVILRFLDIAVRLPDEHSRQTLVRAALREALDLVELLRLHMFREDNIVFASAERLLSAAELDRMAAG